MNQKLVNFLLVVFAVLVIGFAVFVWIDTEPPDTHWPQTGDTPTLVTNP